jgi:hypothetical protein
MFDSSRILRLNNVQSDGEIALFTDNSEKMRIDSSGNVGIGTITPNTTNLNSGTTSGIVVKSGGVAKNNFVALPSTGGSQWDIRESGGSGGEFSMRMFDTSGTHNVQINSNGNHFFNGGSVAIGHTSTGGSTFAICDGANSAIQFFPEISTDTNLIQHYDQTMIVFATNGTIQTSDANEKQQIAALTDAEMTAAKAISQLFKTFKWNDSVAEKGDAARTHTGVIAQDVEAAMTAAGLDAGDYAFFISSTWWETQTEVPAVEAVEEG